MRAINTSIATFAAATLPLFACFTTAQYSPNCPLQGAVFPVPKNLKRDSGAIGTGLSVLQDELQKLINNPLAFDNASTSFQLNLFSKDENLFNFSYAATSLDNTSLPSRGLDENTIFRIGSVSKLLTVYALLAELGTNHLKDPVTKWVPELAEFSKNGANDAVSQVKWDEVTIEALASHSAGLDRDYSLSDFANLINETIAEQAALPPLAPEDIPTCGTTDFLLPSCSRADFLNEVKALHPVTSTFHTPVYSNMAFQILAYALEGITGKSFTDIFQSSIINRLGLSRTSLQPPNSTKEGIIPGDKISSWWSVDLADASPVGGIFSTGADMATLGQSILNSSILSPMTTRQWLRPIAHTADLHVAVGMPWEIHRLLQPVSSGSDHTRVVDLYTKNGMLGGYSTLFVLSPEHDFGFALLTASPTTAAESAARAVALNVIGDIVTSTMVSAFEQAARDEAAYNFGGIYASSNMSLEISVDNAHPGLKLSNWTMGDKDVLEQYTGVPNAQVDARLYPMDLESNGKISFRAVYEGVRNASQTSQPGVVFSQGCLPWGGVAALHYGKIAFDDFVFEVDDKGRATSIIPRITRQTLERTK
ncbi:beta-lactamase/transpeptidase-like protein [Xylaria bambusicola]|uniref:beta-lactamase/transpeptidase-like protein n=1 Tax=Xylaria bambusicola TaxID=326684 RepID=UPI002007AF31|nr:beta-lactamase/transpeptidase-like protein [Xylaria bambusicola]KAI0521240.1 beta-lactamase/transpeptidase-like protein [Xylaria bambusicola]